VVRGIKLKDLSFFWKKKFKKFKEMEDECDGKKKMKKKMDRRIGRRM